MDFGGWTLLHCILQIGWIDGGCYAVLHHCITMFITETAVLTNYTGSRKMINVIDNVIDVIHHNGVTGWCKMVLWS